MKHEAQQESAPFWEIKKNKTARDFRHVSNVLNAQENSVPPLFWRPVLTRTTAVNTKPQHSWTLLTHTHTMHKRWRCVTYWLHQDDGGAGGRTGTAWWCHTCTANESASNYDLHSDPSLSHLDSVKHKILWSLDKMILSYTRFELMKIFKINCEENNFMSNYSSLFNW